MEENEIMMITTEGIIIRIRVSDTALLGRITSGVKLMNLKNDVVMSYCPCECEFCNECNLKNYGCLRLGKLFAVRKQCPLYSEMMVYLLNNGVKKELEWIPSAR